MKRNRAAQSGSTPMCHNAPRPMNNVGGLPSSATPTQPTKRTPPPQGGVHAFFPKSGEPQTNPPTHPSDAPWYSIHQPRSKGLGLTLPLVELQAVTEIALSCEHIQSGSPHGLSVCCWRSGSPHRALSQCGSLDHISENHQWQPQSASDKTILNYLQRYSYPARFSSARPAVIISQRLGIS